MLYSIRLTGDFGRKVRVELSSTPFTTYSVVAEFGRRMPKTEAGFLRTAQRSNRLPHPSVEWRVTAAMMVMRNSLRAYCRGYGPFLRISMR